MTVRYEASNSNSLLQPTKHYFSLGKSVLACLSAAISIAILASSSLWLAASIVSVVVLAAVLHRHWKNFSPSDSNTVETALTLDQELDKTFLIKAPVFKLIAGLLPPFTTGTTKPSARPSQAAPQIEETANSTSSSTQEFTLYDIENKRIRRYQKRSRSQPQNEKTQIRLERVATQHLENPEQRQEEVDLKDLLSFLSHDFRAPMVSIASITELIKLKAPEDFDLTQINSIQTTALGGLELVDDLMIVLSPESTAQKSSQLVDLSQLVEKVLGLAFIGSEQSNMGITTNLDPNLHVWGDADLLQRALTRVLCAEVRHYCEGHEIKASMKSVHDNIIFCLGVKDGDLDTVNSDTELSPGVKMARHFLQTVIRGHGGKVVFQKGAGTKLKITLPKAELLDLGLNSQAALQQVAS